MTSSAYIPFLPLASIAHPGHSRTRLMAMFTAYFDESGHHQDADKIVTLAAIVLSQKDGIALQEKWNRRLRREKKLQGKPFHTTDFKARRDVYDGLDEDEWESLRSDLTAAICNHITFGCVHSIIIQDWNAIMDERFVDPFERKRATYVVLTQICVEKIVQDLSIPTDETLACVFETNQFTKNGIETHYADLRNQPWFDSRLGAIAFDGKRLAQLQAVDMVAHTYYDNQLYGSGGKLHHTYLSFWKSTLIKEAIMNQKSFEDWLIHLAEKERSDG